MKGQRKKKTNKKSCSIAKNDLVRRNLFMMSAKKSTFRTPTHLYPQTSNFSLSTTNLWASLIGIENFFTLCNFGIFLEKFNSDINIVRYNYFLANSRSICYSREYNKTDRKGNSFSPSWLLWKANYLQCFHYKRNFRMETV